MLLLGLFFGAASPVCEAGMHELVKIRERTINKRSGFIGTASQVASFSSHAALKIRWHGHKKPHQLGWRGYHKRVYISAREKIRDSVTLFLKFGNGGMNFALAEFVNGHALNDFPFAVFDCADWHRGNESLLDTIRPIRAYSH